MLAIISLLSLTVAVIALVMFAHERVLRSADDELLRKAASDRDEAYAIITRLENQLDRARRLSQTELFNVEKREEVIVNEVKRILAVEVPSIFDAITLLKQMRRRPQRVLSAAASDKTARELGDSERSEYPAEEETAVEDEPPVGAPLFQNPDDGVMTDMLTQ